MRDIVDYVWSLRDAPGHARERIVPSGTVELVINLAEDEFRIYRAAAPPRRMRGAIVSGCYRSAFDIDTREHASLVGVHFKPGGAGALGIHAGEIADTHVSLEELWGTAALELREQMLEASADQRCALVERALLARRGRHEERSVVAAARTALERGDDVGVVARMVQLSRRRLIQLFHADVGMTPKRYARVRRFQRALALAASRSWSEIAFACDYYDQAHLCREWAELTGLTPSAVAFAKQIRVKENHVALVKSIQDEPARAR